MDAISAAAEVLADLRQQYGTERVFVTGHSLGGYLGEIISTRYSVPGVVFCAPGPDSVHGLTKHNGVNLHARFQNINADTDPAGNINPGFYLHAQWSVFVSDLHAHGIDNMIEALQDIPGSEGITNHNVLNFVNVGWDNNYWLQSQGSRR